MDRKPVAYERSQLLGELVKLRSAEGKLDYENMAYYKTIALVEMMLDSWSRQRGSILGCESALGDLRGDLTALRSDAERVRADDPVKQSLAAMIRALERHLEHAERAYVDLVMHTAMNSFEETQRTETERPTYLELGPGDICGDLGRELLEKHATFPDGFDRQGRLKRRSDPGSSP